MRNPGYAIRYTLFHAQCLYRVDGCSALRRDNAGSKGAESKGEDRHGKHDRVPSFDLIELVGDQPRAANGDRNADGEPDEDLQESIVQNKTDDIAAICTQSHAHTNFAGPALDGISGDSIEADGSENQRKKTEEAGQLCDGPLLIQVGIDLLPQSLNIKQSDIGIDVAEDAANLLLQAFDALAVQLENRTLDEVGVVIDALHNRVIIMRALSQRHKEQRARRLAVREIPAVSCIADNSDDFKGRAVAGQVKAEVRTNGVFAGLEKCTGRRLH